MLRHTEEGVDGKASATAYSEPHLQVSAPKGIAATTPADAVLVAGTQLTVAAQKDANVAAGGNLSVAVADGLSLFTHGKAGGESAAGIAMHAASGKVGVMSFEGRVSIAADKAVSLSSVQGIVNVEARKHVLLNAAGAQIRVVGSQIEVHAPGMTTFKAGQHVFTGPAGSETENTLPKAKPAYHEQFVLRDEISNEPVTFRPYRIEDAKGGLLAQGITDEHGRTMRVYTEKPEEIKVFY